MISLDGTSTAYLGAEMPAFVKALLQVAKFQQGIGFTSVLAPLTTNRAKLLSSGYTKEEINNMITFAGFLIHLRL